jgi:hypothetical protein
MPFEMRDFRRSASNGSKYRLTEYTRRLSCFRCSSSECAVFAIKGKHPEVPKVEYINRDARQLYHFDCLSALHQRLTLTTHNSINRLLLKQTLHTLHTNTTNDQYLHNNVVLSIPKGRDQADSRRMLVSPHQSHLEALLFIIVNVRD